MEKNILLFIPSSVKSLIIYLFKITYNAMNPTRPLTNTMKCDLYATFVLSMTFAVYFEKIQQLYSGMHAKLHILSLLCLVINSSS